MLKFKKLSKVILITLLMSITLAIAANAATYSVNGASLSYTASWQTTAYFDEANNGRLVYGFNNYFFDEDYCKSFHNTNSHSAQVMNNNHSWQKAGPTGAGKWTSQVSMGHGDSPQWEAIY